MANAGLIVAGSRIVASVMASIAPLAVIKGADQSVTSSTVMVNDSALVLPVVANAAYLFDCYLDYEGGASGSSDLQWVWAVPGGGAAMRYQPVGTTTSGGALTGQTLAGGDTQAVSSNGAGVLRGVSMNGTLVTGSAAGTLQLRWAQNTSSATPTIVHAQSYMALWRIS